MDYFMHVLRPLIQPIIVTILVLLGTFYSYRGMKKGNNLLFRYTLWFFLLRLLQQVIGLIQYFIYPLHCKMRCTSGNIAK